MLYSCLQMDNTCAVTLVRMCLYRPLRVFSFTADSIWSLQSRRSILKYL